MAETRVPPGLHLPGVEANPKPGAYASLVEAARARGAEYPKIWDLFAYQHGVTRHMGAFTQGVLRESSSISPAWRELIAAYTSHLNQCGFCTQAHAHTAAQMLGDEALVWSVLRDVENASLSNAEKALLRFVRKVTLDLSAVTDEDAATLRAAGWDDDAIYFTVTTCALFNFYNRWITAAGVPQMSDEAHRAQGQALAARGYTRD